MGDYTDEMAPPEDVREKYQYINDKSLGVVMDIWRSIYGPNDKNLMERLSTLEKDLQEFWDIQVEKQEKRKSNILKSIEDTGAQAFALEKVLGLPRSIETLPEDVPLLELEEQLWKLLSSYQELKQKRLEEFSVLQDKEKELCLVLGEQPIYADLLFHSSTHHPEIIPTRRKDVPTCEDVASCEERIEELQNKLVELEHDFENYKYELRDLLKDCEVTPFTAAERFACSVNGETKPCFPATKQNLNKLKAAVEEYRKQKESLMMEANHIKEEITKLSKKMLKDPEDVKIFLAQNNGFGKSVLEKLKQKLAALKEERSHKLKELILSNRTQLEEWWTRCLYSDEQKAMFRPYNVDYYSEDILDLHELELEQLQNFYNQHKRIFQLTEKHQEMWARLLHLESQASQADRLFSNRGGRLLQEEKERKLIQKKVPAIKTELVTLLHEFKAQTNKDFLCSGVPLIEILEQQEESREISKENQKLSRKMANTEKVLLESRLGSRPVVGAKRKLANQPPNSSTKVLREERPGTRLGLPSPGGVLRGAGASYATLHTPVRTPAASTPENGSPSYESFQEYIEKSNGKEVCRSSTKSQAQRVLRPRNINNTTVTKMTPTVNQYKTPKTPVKTPSKIPFRIATGSKIPSIVPPISPRSAKKLTTPRSRLPLIF